MTEGDRNKLGSTWMLQGTRGIAKNDAESTFKQFDSTRRDITTNDRTPRKRDVLGRRIPVAMGNEDSLKKRERAKDFPSHHKIITDDYMLGFFGSDQMKSR